MEFLDYFVKNGILIEPFLTKKCNFKCDFCMYDCSPKSSSEFISDEMLEKLKKQVVFLQALHIPVTINLLGGEPTLFFDKLKHVVDIVATWNVFITIPTNGWWLENKSSTEKFINVFKNLVSKNGNCFDSNNYHGLSIRISDEKYHQIWRRGNNNKEHFTEIFYDPKYSYLRPDEKHPWIQWQTLSPNYLINPHGRGKDISNVQDFLEKNVENKQFCIQEYNKMILESIHYELNGDISSTCQFGNEHNIGTIDDNILYIVLLLEEYNKYRHNIGRYNCYNCTDMFGKWKKNELEKVKYKYSLLNNFDLNIWETIMELK